MDCTQGRIWLLQAAGYSILGRWGRSLTPHGMRGEFCPSCGEGVWHAESCRWYAKVRAALLRSVKGDVGGEIRLIRKGLKLTRA